MDQLKETLRLRWQLWGAAGLQKLRYRRELWVATFRYRLAELYVRICLARHSFSIYRREVAHHREETALMKLAFWEDRLAEAEEGDWLDPEEPDSCTPAETGVIASVRGIPWRIWGRLSVIGWLLLIPASWISVIFVWSGMVPLSLGFFGAWLGLAAYSNGVPGATALLNPKVRRRLLYMPEAAALASLTLSAMVGLCTGIMATCLHLEIPVHIALLGVAFGITSFPLSFGLVFPLAIPLGCSIVVWTVTKRNGRISHLAYALLTGVSAAGWLAVAVIGAVVGSGGQG